VLGAVLLAGALAVTRVAGAAGIGAFYQATAIVTGTDMRSRPTGFARCLREVLVKVSGDPRLRGDPRVAELARHADRLILSFDYVDPLAGIRPHDDQGTYDRSYDLTVHFDPTRIDRALTALGETPWRGRRPAIVPVLAVRGFGEPGHQPAYLLSEEEPRAADQRGSFANAAHAFGLALRIPNAAELAAWHASADRFPALPAESDPNEAVVAGTLEWESALPGWVGAWHMRWRGIDYAWGVSGVNFDRAFDELASGVVRIASGHGAPD
jgi:hypothetical protein